MRVTLSFWTQASRITFFTSPNCSLCNTAKAVVKNVQARRQFEYVEINIRENGQEQWMNKYAFDTPVIHVEASRDPVDLGSDSVPAGQKLMHRFTEDQVEGLLNKVSQD